MVTAASKKAFAQYKISALEFVTERLEHFNRFYGFTIAKVFIKNQTTRWGSCSKLGNLNFTYRLALLPSELADYVIVHELCHLGEFNHSKAFWDLVEKTIPNHRALRQRLRTLRIQNS